MEIFMNTLTTVSQVTTDQDPSTVFDMQLVAGGIKSAMKEVQASSRDLWSVEIDSINVLPGFNVRTLGDDYDAHIRELADSIKAEGFYQDKPLAGYVARVGDKQVIYLTDGHCRLAATLLAISEGAEITRLPMVVSSQGTSMEDLTVALYKTNTGKPLTPYETGVVCKRLSRFGWDVSQIASRLNIGSTYVEGLLLLVSAPFEIREMVQKGQVSATMAIQALRTKGDGALAMLQAGLEVAKTSGKSKVTAKHLVVNQFKRDVKKSAPKMFDVLMAVQTDPGYQSITSELREKLDELVKQLKEAKDKEKAGKTVPTDEASVAVESFKVAQIKTTEMQDQAIAINEKLIPTGINA
jgi:ParB family chromosome partitioning protein